MNTYLHLKKIILCTCLLFVGFIVFSQTRYNIVMNMYDDPRTKMAFNWFTTSNTTSEQVQVSIGTGTFIPTQTVTVSGIIPQNVHKAVVTGLTPNTTYSFRVGKSPNDWSSIGTFTTSKDNKDPFSFIYVTDSQVEDTGMLRTNAKAAFTKYPNAKFWLHCGDLI